MKFNKEIKTILSTAQKNFSDSVSVITVFQLWRIYGQQWFRKNKANKQKENKDLKKMIETLFCALTKFFQLWLSYYPSDDRHCSCRVHNICKQIDVWTVNENSSKTHSRPERLWFHNPQIVFSKGFQFGANIVLGNKKTPRLNIIKVYIRILQKLSNTNNNVDVSDNSSR